MWTDLNINELENQCIEIHKPNSKPFIVVNWYRPPNSPIGLFSHLENLIARLDLTNLEFFLHGDMNADMASTNYDNNVRQLINIADIYGLHQLISEPTRITDKSSTLIDLIYTNCPERVVCSGVAYIKISYHSLVYAFRKLSINFRKGHSSITYRNLETFKLFNWRAPGGPKGESGGRKEGVGGQGGERRPTNTGRKGGNTVTLQFF